MPWHNKARGKWVARVMVNRERVWLGDFDTKREALEAEATYRSERKRAPNQLSIAEVRERWLRDYGTQAGWRESTRLHNAERTKAFNKANGNRRVDDYTVPEAYRWATENPGSVMAVRAMFGFARKLGARTDNPFERLGAGKTKTKEIRKGRGALTEEEVDSLAAMALALHGEWHRAMVLFAAYTGLRAGELYGLKFSDLGSDSVTVARAWNQRTKEFTLPKTGPVRTVVLPRQARDAIGRVERGLNQEYVFVSPRDKRHFSATGHYPYWSKLRDAWALSLDDSHWLRCRGDGLKFHELRHTCATVLLERGVPAESVAAQLGHGDNGKLVLSTYGHPNEARMLDQVRVALDRPVAGEVPVLRRVEGGHAS